MSCQSCGSITKTCGCTDTPYTTPIQNSCDTNCIPGCAEYTNAKCVILTDGVNDIGIQPGDTLESIIQRLVLAITNPECIGLPSLDGLLLQVNDVNNVDQTVLNLVEGTGINIVDNGNGSVTISCNIAGYTVNNGLNEDPANNFKLGGFLIENTVIDGNDLYDLSFDNLDSLTATGVGTIDLKSTGDYKQTAVNHSFYKTNGDRLLNVESTLGQMTLDGYYASTGVLYTDTPAYVLSVDNLGNILKSPYISEITGAISGDNGITANTTSNVRLGGPLVTDTIIRGGTGVGSPFDLYIGSLAPDEPIGVLSLYANILKLVTPNVAAGTAVVGTVLKLTSTTGAVEFGQPITLTTAGTTGAATFTGGVLNIPNYTYPAATILSVDNGLRLNPADSSEAWLGGTLVANTTITVPNAYTFKAEGNTTTAGKSVLEVNNIGGSLGRRALTVTSNGQEPTLYVTHNSSGTSQGIYINNASTSSQAYGILSDTKVTPIIGRTSQTANSTQVQLLKLHNQSTGTGANNIGGYISLNAATASNSDQEAARIAYKFTDATTLTKKSQLEFYTANPTIGQRMTIKEDGEIQFNSYSTGAFVATPSYLLGVDASGNVVQTKALSPTFAGRISGNGALASLITINNDTAATLTLSNPSTGNFTITASSAIFTTTDTIVLIQSGLNPRIFTASVSSTTTIDIIVYDNTLTLSNDVSGSMIKIEIY